MFRHVDARWPFLWETKDQPPGRWHGEGEGPANYFADTPDGAWAEFLRHEEITDPKDVETIRRAIWAVALPEEPFATARLPRKILLGDLRTYAACQAAARRLRARGAKRLLAPSAALLPGNARGWRVSRGVLKPGPRQDGKVYVLFGLGTDVVGWLAAVGRPNPELLSRVRHFVLQ